MLTDKQIENLTNEQRVEILDDAIEQILDNPEDWNQETWHCLTGFCLAGIIASTHGPGIVDSKVVEEYDIESVITSSYLLSGEDIAAFANKVLGFPKYDMPRLFESSNTIHTLIARRNDYALSRGVASREWDQRRIARSERIAAGTNVARYNATRHSPLTAKEAAEIYEWPPRGIETLAYSAEMRRQKRLRGLLIEQYKKEGKK